MNKPFRFFKWTGKKAVMLLVVTVLLVLGVTDVTLSLLFDRTDPLENVFEPAKVVLSFANEHLESGGETGHRLIVNKGEVPLFIRVFAVVNWESTADEHTILAEMPKVTSNLAQHEVQNPDVYLKYHENFNTDKWFIGSDGFIYCKEPLQPGGTLHILEEAWVYTSETRNGYAIHIEIIAEGIQADPVMDGTNRIDPVKEAWPAVQVENNMLVPVASDSNGGSSSGEGGSSGESGSSGEGETTEGDTNDTP